MIWILFIAVIVGLDRITKMIVLEKVGPFDTIPVIKGFFSIVYTENTGAALGILKNGRAFLIPLTMITAIVIGYFLFKAQSRLLKASLSMVLGGALGNLIDRIFRGSVTDFLDFQFGSWHFWTFNVADVFIVIGTVVLAWYMIFIYKEPETGITSQIGNESDIENESVKTGKAEETENLNPDKTNENDGE